MGTLTTNGLTWYETNANLVVYERTTNQLLKNQFYHIKFMSNFECCCAWYWYSLMRWQLGLSCTLAIPKCSDSGYVLIQPILLRRDNVLYLGNF